MLDHRMGQLDGDIFHVRRLRLAGDDLVDDIAVQGAFQSDGKPGASLGCPAEHLLKLGRIRLEIKLHRLKGDRGDAESCRLGGGGRCDVAQQAGEQCQSTGEGGETHRIEDYGYGASGSSRRSALPWA